ncbi:MAG: 3-isopropylmalate dehydratase large subunit [Candidatus Latescibacterota bacterium]
MSSVHSLFDKIWNRHVVAQRDDGETLLYVDRNFVHEGPFYAFDGLRRDGRGVHRPLKQIAIADHYLPTLNRARGMDAVSNPEARQMIERLTANTREFGIPVIGMGNPRQGIMHVVGPELGLIQPGMVITAADSHATTNGAFGTFSFGIGASEIKHVLATQTLWQRKPRMLRVTVNGEIPGGVTAKDIILVIIAKLSISGGSGYVVEYAGSTIRGMTMEQRMTICNMSIELGARSGIVAPDEKTYAYLKGREFAPIGDAWSKALDVWHTLPSDPGATYDREVEISAEGVAPMVTWGTVSDDALPITESVPYPIDASTEDQRVHIKHALEYMGLKAGQPLVEIRIDRVFIGSCSNARLDDLRAAAAVVKGRRAVVPSVISPGSTDVKRRAEAEGLNEIFLSAGFEWRDSGCSMCVGANGDIVQPGERCASTSPRNFENRQGRGARTHLVSPPMAAAAAVTGKLTDVRTLA